jgi:hypothetical protein
MTRGDARLIVTLLDLAAFGFIVGCGVVAIRQFVPF